MFKFTSDVHDRIDELLEVEGDPNCTMILLGDITEGDKLKKYKKVLDVLSKKFKTVIFISGNHEYFKKCIRYTKRKLQEISSKYSNVYFLDDSSIEIDGVHYIGSTFWSDLSSNSVEIIARAERMHDYKYIRNGPEDDEFKRKLSTNDTMYFHHKGKSFISGEVQRIYNEDSNAKIVVLTHHAPSERSIHDDFKDSKYNSFFCSNLDTFVFDLSEKGVKYWLHGHIHQDKEYKIGDCTVLANPMGHSHEITNYFVKKYEI